MFSSLMGAGAGAPPGNSRARRVQQLRQQRLKSRGAAGGSADEEDDAMVISAYLTGFIALLIVAAGAGLASLLFSVYQPDCVKDLSPVASSSSAAGAASVVVKEGTAGASSTGAVGARRLEAGVGPLSSDPTSTSTSPAAGFPPHCTPEQMDVLKRQLPAGGCELRKDRPFVRKGCSFSAATTCGGVPYWFHEHIVEHDLEEGAEEFTAILVGCNSADDAIDLLRLATRDAGGTSYNVQAWRDKFASTDDPDDRIQVRVAECPARTVSVIPGSPPQRARIYGIEAMPKTYRQLEKTKAALGYGDELDFSHIAIALNPDTTQVHLKDPIAAVEVGLVTWTRACKKLPKDDPSCVDVPVDNIDTWIMSKPRLADNPAAPIHYMSVTVVGNDYEVLQGAARTLNRVQYLDLGYHWYGDWGTSKRSLKDLMFRLKKRGFACYWPGDGGNMWRITDCWQDHYELHFFANIACVNTNITAAKPLADRMERMFHETLKRPSLQFGQE
jgi:hypothetical protein